MLELDVAIRAPDARYHVPPQARRFEHVRLVHGGHLAPAQPRQLERAVRYALHFVLAIDFRVHAHALAILGENAAGITEIDSTHELADDHQVGAAHAVGLQRR